MEQENTMKARDLMTKNVQVCHSDDPLNVAAKIMWDADCGCVPVVDAQQKLVGMITDRDICMAAFLQGKHLSEIKVEDAMTREPEACRSDDDVLAVHAAMRRRAIRRVPVTEREGRISGVISLNDLAVAAKSGARENSPQEVFETLQSICQRQGQLVV
jgi:CBS domain-containing protein